MKDFFQKSIGSIIGVLVSFASLIVILQFLVSPIYTRLDHIEDQVNNHIPTQIRTLDQKIDQINQRLGQKIDQTNQRLDRLFEMLAKD